MSVRLQGCSRSERRWKVKASTSRRSPFRVPGRRGKAAGKVRLTLAMSAPGAAAVEEAREAG